MMPKVERLPPVTVAFLRIVRGVEAVRLQCEACKAVHVAPWADLGLPYDSPFPPMGTTWKCSLCGGTHITATAELTTAPKGENTAPIETAAPDTAADDNGAIPSELRERLEAVMARLGKAGG